MTITNHNVETIQSLYAAFGRGDVAGLLSHVTGDAEFSFAGGSPDIPWHGPWRGHAQIQHFFSVIGEQIAFEAMEPLQFTSSQDAVAVRLHVSYTVRRTGKRVDEQQIHWWDMRDGKVRGQIHFEDTAQVMAAAR